MGDFLMILRRCSRMFRCFYLLGRVPKKKKGASLRRFLVDFSRVLRVSSSYSSFFLHNLFILSFLFFRVPPFLFVFSSWITMSFPYPTSSLSVFTLSLSLSLHLISSYFTIPAITLTSHHIVPSHNTGISQYFYSPESQKEIKIFRIQYWLSKLIKNLNIT